MGERLGQHFLHNRHVLDRIAAAACPPGEPVVIEIGPGRGALTELILERAQRVIAIELDPAMLEHLRSRFANEPRLELIGADVLEVDLAQWGPAALAGNLPYYITSPIVERILAAGPTVRQSVILIQREVAERIAAQPGSRDYGYLSVATQLYAETRMLFHVAPGSFSPPPKVDSTVLLLRPKAGPEGVSRQDLLRLVSHSFRQKRKTLRNNLTGSYPSDLIDTLPEASLRAEQLAPERFVELYRRLGGSNAPRPA